MKKNTSKKMPVMFIGHGSPMNAIEDNNYTKALKGLNRKFDRPKSILVISAHWETKGIWVTGMDRPKTIHDFYGFPKELYQIQYPTPGDRSFARMLAANVSANIDKENWGLDHGTWAILKHVYPDANIPVIQLSLNMGMTMDEHFKLGQKLTALRNEGVLIIGSGNLVHNLKEISWKPGSPAREWAIAFDSWCKEKIDNYDLESLVHKPMTMEIGKKSHPTIEHYLPLLYVLGASENKDKVSYIYEGVQNASISMRSIMFS